MALYEKSGTPLTLRSPDELRALVKGFEILPPGVVFTPEWRPDGPPDPGESYERAMVLAGLGRRR